MHTADILRAKNWWPYTGDTGNYAWFCVVFWPRIWLPSVHCDAGGLLFFQGSSVRQTNSHSSVEPLRSEPVCFFLWAGKFIVVAILHFHFKFTCNSAFIFACVNVCSWFDKSSNNTSGKSSLRWATVREHLFSEYICLMLGLYKCLDAYCFSSGANLGIMS